MREIGSGAYGICAQCLDTLTNSRVAIKRVPRFLADIVDAKRVLREVKLLSALSTSGARSPYVVTLLAVEGAGGGWVSEGLLLPGTPQPPLHQPWLRLEDVYLVMTCYDTDLHKVLYGKNQLTMQHIA